MFKRRLIIPTAIAAAATLVLAGCGSKSSTGTSATSPAATGSSTGSAASGSAPAAAPLGKAPSIALMIPGTLGDLGFFDSGATGMKEAAAQLGATTKIVEGGANNTAAWKSNLQALSGKYDVIITMTSSITDQLTAVAKQFPQQKYIILDTSVDLPNVASVSYRQNDGAFLSGVLAASASEDTKAYPLSGGHKDVGFVGGMNIPVIQDFAVGFEAGAKAVDPSIKVQVSYVGNFSDSQAGYNQAASMYANGADVVFAAAGGAGLGVLKASADKGRYSIGVDSNQNSQYPKNILGSSLKNVDVSILDLSKKLSAGTLKFGTTYVYGIANNGVSLVLNDALVSAATKTKLADFSAKVSSSAIKVPCVDPFCITVTK